MISAARRALLRVGNWGGYKADLAAIAHNIKTMKHGVYDFAKLGGAVGAVNLLDDDGAVITIPASALILECFVVVETAVTSGGSATIALKIEGTADMLAATGKASFTANAAIAGVPVSGTLSTAVLTTAVRNLTATIGTAALTAGKIHVFVTYVHAFGN